MQYLKNGCFKRILLMFLIVAIMLVGVSGVFFYIYQNPLERDICSTAIQQINNDSAFSADYISVQIPSDIQLQQINSNNVHQLAQIDLIFSTTETSVAGNIDILDQLRPFRQFRYGIVEPGGFTLASENPNNLEVVVVVNPSSVDIIGWPPAVHVCDNNGNQRYSFRMPGSPFNVISAVSDVSLSNDGLSFAIANGMGVYTMDADNYQLSQLLTTRADHISYNDSDNMLLIIKDRLHGQGSSEIFVWDLINSEKITLLEDEADFEPVGFIGDDHLIAIINEDGTIIIWGVTE